MIIVLRGALNFTHSLTHSVNICCHKTNHHNHVTRKPVWPLSVRSDQMRNSGCQKGVYLERWFDETSWCSVYHVGDASQLKRSVVTCCTASWENRRDRNLWQATWSNRSSRIRQI